MSTENPVEEVVESPEEATEQTTPVEDTTEAPVEEVVEYKPNYNYKVKDEELSFDERFHGVIKSKEDEDYVRDLYTKSAGLDSYKAKYTGLEEQAQALLGGYKNLETIQEKRDIAALQKVFKFDDDLILERAEAILKEQQLPEEQRHLLESNRQIQDELASLKREHINTQKLTEEQALAQDKQELKTLITTKYSDVAKAMQDSGFDMAYEVAMRGHMQYKSSGTEPTIGAVTEEVANLYKHLTSKQEVVPEPLMEQTTQEVLGLPTLPNLAGGTVNSVKKRPANLAELQAIAAQIPSR